MHMMLIGVFSATEAVTTQAEVRQQQVALYSILSVIGQKVVEHCLGFAANTTFPLARTAENRRKPQIYRREDREGTALTAIRT